MKKAIIITGSSRGIGAATAKLAASKGYRVCINYHKSEEAAHKLLEEIGEAGGDACLVQADVTKESEILRLFKEAGEAFGTIYGLVNNAGIIETEMRLEDMTAGRFERIFNANITGPFICAREAVKHMSTKHGGQGGAIVNVSSVAARLGSANTYVDYAASKAAIDTMTIGLAQEVATDGIRVNGVRPGITDTDIHASGGNPDRATKLAHMIPMKRAGQPSEIAEAILWFLSDEASYATGSILDISGGR